MVKGWSLKSENRLRNTGRNKSLLGKATESREESMCGWLKDKFGVSWQIIPTILSNIMSDPAKAGKAAKAFMAMRKLNIEQIVQASIS